MPGETMPAGGANLRMMAGSGRIGALRLTLWDGGALRLLILTAKVGIERAGAMRKHG